MFIKHFSCPGPLRVDEFGGPHSNSNNVPYRVQLLGPDRLVAIEFWCKWPILLIVAKLLRCPVECGEPWIAARLRKHAITATWGNPAAWAEQETEANEGVE